MTAAAFARYADGALKWRKPRVCPKCAHLHHRPQEAKFNGRTFYCTWCSTRLAVANPLAESHARNVAQCRARDEQNLADMFLASMRTALEVANG